MNDADLDAVIDAALAEDAADRDVTSLAIVPADLEGSARLVAREGCTLAGLSTVEAVFRALGARTTLFAHDGDRVEAGAIVATVQGPVRALLAGERTALNFVQHLSGIATLTRRFVDAAAGVQIRDTRKTTPGLRRLEKAAVLVGGGVNHRMSLADRTLIKDNHLAVAGGVSDAVKVCRDHAPALWVEVEADTLEQVADAVDAGADEVLLDNMTPVMLREAVALVAGRCALEASGGVTLKSVAEIAATGVGAISVGALTHSAPAIDLTFEIITRGRA